MGRRTRGGVNHAARDRHQGEEEPPVIAVIGGGFTGTMVAVHLRVGPWIGPSASSLIEKGPRFARARLWDAMRSPPAECPGRH